MPAPMTLLGRWEDGEVWSEDGVPLAQSRPLALLFGPRADGAGA